MLMRKHQNGLWADLHVQLGIWVMVGLPRAGKLVTLCFFQYLFPHGSNQDICDNCKGQVFNKVVSQWVSQLVTDMGRLWSDLGPIKKEIGHTFCSYNIFFCVLVFWIFYVNFENYFPGQLVAKCCSRQYFSNCCNGSFLLIIVLNNFLPNFANTFSRQYFWANCCHG